jgi:hypothetical protein
MTPAAKTSSGFQVAATPVPCGSCVLLPSLQHGEAALDLLHEVQQFSVQPFEALRRLRSGVQRRARLRVRVRAW